MLPHMGRRDIFRLGGAAIAALAVLRHPFLHRHEDVETASTKAGAQKKPPGGATALAWSGDATQTTVEVSACTTGATSVGLAMAASPDLSGATYLTSSPPNSSGWTKWSVTGLAPGTTYYHQVTDTPKNKPRQLIGTVSSLRTLRPAGTAGTTRIAIGCCQHNDTAVRYAFDDMAAWAPDRFVHVGDFGYPNYLSTNTSTHMRNWAESCNVPGVRAIQAKGCMDYISSDHDTNGSGENNKPNFNDPVTAADITAWQQVVPARMEDSRQPRRGRYRADVEGNVRFVKLDTRSLDKTDTVGTGADPRSPNSTMLGATQLTWLKSQIDQAAQQRQVIIMYSDVAWNGVSPGPPIPRTYCDKWPSYIYERDLISDYAKSKGANLFIFFGDSHGLQFDDGTHEKNGFPSICVAPLDSPLHMHFQDAYQWNYPAGIDEGGGPYRSAQHYVRLTIQDNGSGQITVTAEARDCSAETGGPKTVNTMVKTYHV